MMQAKNEPKKAKKSKKPENTKFPKVVNNDLYSQFKQLSADEQTIVTHFFQLHNMAIYNYNRLSVPAQNYVNLCINYSQESQEVSNN